MVIAKIKPILAMLLPTMLPITSSVLPEAAANTELTNSGKDVPRATKVKPIVISLKPNLLAIFAAYSTKTLELLIKIIKAINHNNIIVLYLYKGFERKF